MRRSSTFVVLVTVAAVLAACGQQISPTAENESPEVVQAQDAFCGNKTGGGRNGAYYDASVSSTQWSTNYTYIYDQARAQWSGISSNVALNKTSSTANNPDKYYVGNTAIAGRLGITTPYNYQNGTLAETGADSDWVKANVSIYNNTFDQNGFTTTERLGTATHELGHSLKLAHPGDGSCRSVAIPTGDTAVMVQGRKAYGVQQYDQRELKAVWGL